jgi:hypothetical protein
MNGRYPAPIAEFVPVPVAEFFRRAFRVYQWPNVAGDCCRRVARHDTADYTV